MHALATSWNVGAMPFFRGDFEVEESRFWSFGYFWYIFCFFLQGTEFEVVRKTKLNQGMSLNERRIAEYITS